MLLVGVSPRHGYRTMRADHHRITAVLLILALLAGTRPCLARCCRNTCRKPREETAKFEFSWGKTTKFWGDHFSKLREVAHENPIVGAGLAAGAVTLTTFGALYLFSRRRFLMNLGEVDESFTPMEP